ncbi:MAG: UDP-3-O-(3-hydroxymyristoyl)glucosamine N-acyltransferase [Chitinophagales bacterium]
MRLPYPISVQEIAKMIDAEIVEGKANSINGLNEIHKVIEGNLTFVDHPKYYKKSLLSAASVVMINTKTAENPLEKTLLFCKDPFEAYNKLVKHFRPFIPIQKNISDTATIGKNTIISAGVVVGHHVSIGENCVIHPNVVIYAHSVIGDNVIIHANSVIGADAYYYQRRTAGYQKMLSCGRVVIKDNVEIGAACTIDKGVSGDTVVGKGTKLDNQVHLAHGVVVGENCLMAAQVGVAGKTIIGNSVILWGQVGVSKSLTIGDNVVVYAQSGVPKSLKPNKTYFGSPAQEARQQMKNLAMINRLDKIWAKTKKL